VELSRRAEQQHTGPAGSSGAFTFDGGVENVPDLEHDGVLQPNRHLAHAPQVSYSPEEGICELVEELTSSGDGILREASSQAVQIPGESDADEVLKAFVEAGCVLFAPGRFPGVQLGAPLLDQLTNASSFPQGIPNLQQELEILTGVAAPSVFGPAWAQQPMAAFPGSNAI
jgi:hypothetical protein